MVSVIMNSVVVMVESMVECCMCVCEGNNISCYFSCLIGCDM